MKGLYLLVGALLVTSFALGQTIQTSGGGTGAWNDPASWSPAIVPTTANSTLVEILNGHSITITALLTLDQTVIRNGGTLTINSGVTVTLGTGAGDDINVNTGGILNVNGIVNLVPGLGGTANRLRVSGRLNNNGTFMNSTPTKFIFEAGSNYFHLFDGSSANAIPTAGWNATSTITISGYGPGGATAPTGLNQPLGNFVWNSPNQDSYIDLTGQPAIVNGNFQVEDTGSGGFYFNQGGGANTSLSISGNLIINGGLSAFIGQTGSDGILAISGDLIITGGYYQLVEDVDASVEVLGDISISGSAQFELSAIAATANVNVEGDFSYTGGDILVSGGIGNINFSGTSSIQQNFISQLVPSGAINYSVGSSAILNVAGSNFIGGPGGLNLSGTLQLGSTAASGAIQTGTLNGNVRVPTVNRIYQSGSTIEYNGVGAQFIGNGFPSGGGNVNLTISNSFGVTLSSNLSIVALRTLFLSTGNLIIGNQTLTINGTVTGSGGVVGGPLSNVTIGGTGPFGTLTFNGTTQLLNFTIGRNDGEVSLGGDLTVLGTFSHGLGEIDFSNRTLTISGPYTNTGGTFVANATATMVINGSGAITGNIPMDGSIGTFTLNRTNGATVTSLEVSNSLNLFAGTLTGSIDLAVQTPTDIIETIERRNGSLSGTLSAAAYNLIYSPTTTIATGSELKIDGSVRNFTKNGTGQVDLNKVLDINGMFTMNAGALNGNGNLIYLSGNYSKNGGTTDYTGSTVTFDGSTTLFGASTFRFPDVVVTGMLNFGAANIEISGNIDHDNVGGSTVAGTGIVKFTGNTTLTTNTLSVPNFHNLSIDASSTLAITCLTDCGAEPNQYGINVNGSWDSNSGSAVFTPNVSRVILNGTSQSITMLTGQAFSTLELSAASNITLSQPLNVTQDLVIGTTASLNTGSSGQKITVGDDFIINGTFVPNTGTVEFNGTTNQSINRVAGTGAADKDFYNITVNKTSGRMNIESTVSSTRFRVGNEFKIALNGADPVDVDFDGPDESANNGVLVLRSTSANTARVTAVPTGAATLGRLTVERYIQNDAAVGAYRYLAAPVSGATVADWLGEIQITGAFSNPSTGAGIPNPNSPSLYRWNETAGGLESVRYQAYPNNILNNASTFGLDNARGYAIYIRNTGTPTTDVRGTLRFGDVNVALTMTGAQANAAGYHLIGNPYPSPIDWDAVDLTIDHDENPGTPNIAGPISPIISMKNNVDNADQVLGQFIYYTQGGVSVGNFNGVIPSAQAFWVRTSGTATLPFKESQKISSPSPDVNPTVIREAAIADILRVKMYGNGLADETVVYVRDAATDGLDLQFDAEKRPNDFLNLYTYFGNTEAPKLAINGFHEVSCSKTIKLGLKQINATTGANIMAPGSYNIEFSQLESFNGAYKFYLLDAFAGATRELTMASPVYTFNVTSNLTSVGDSRFQITMVPASENIFAAAAQTSLSCGPGQITLTATGAPANGSYRWYESLEATIPLSTTNEFQTPSITQSKAYYVSAVNATGCEGAKVQVTAEVVTMTTPSALGGSSCGAGEIVLTASGAPLGGSYKWYGSPDAAEILATTSLYTTSVLTANKTYYVSTVSSSGCESGRIEVKAEIITIAEVQIVEHDDVLTSNYETGNQWYFDDVAIEGAVNKTLIPQQSGTYTVRVTQGNCTTSASREYKASVVTALEPSMSGQGVINIYPNPVESKVTIQIVSDQKVTVGLINMLGVQLEQIELHSGNDGKQSGQLDMHTMAAGIYLMNIQDGNRSYQKRILKK